jgi:outer membrane protein TolC
MRAVAHRSQLSRGVLTAVLALAVSGCVGPNFVPPAAPAVDGYLPGKLASPTPGLGGPKIKSQHFVSGADVSARWWAAFQSQSLNQLIRQAVNHNPNLQAAESAIKVAQYNALAQRGLWMPQVNGNSTSSQILQSNAGTVFGGDLGAVPQTQFSLVTHQLTVTFVPDSWGANFRAVENLDAVTEQQLFQYELWRVYRTATTAPIAKRFVNPAALLGAYQLILELGSLRACVENLGSEESTAKVSIGLQ